MGKGIKKEKWGKPKLSILVRGKPEERILQGCKRGGAMIDEGPNSSWGYCDYPCWGPYCSVRTDS